MRISSLLLLLPLSACGRGGEEQAVRTQEIKERQALAAAPKFLCAQGAGELRPDCTAERLETDKGWVITLHHPDGHFRRLLAGDDGSVTAADGAQKAQVTHGDAGVAVAIGGDRYLLPVQR